MAIRTSRELVALFRQNALDCEEAGKEAAPEERTRFLEAAAHYRMLAEKTEPSPKRESSAQRLGLSRVVPR